MFYFWHDCSLQSSPSPVHLDIFLPPCSFEVLHVVPMWNLWLCSLAPYSFVAVPMASTIHGVGIFLSLDPIPVDSSTDFWPFGESVPLPSSLVSGISRNDPIFWWGMFRGCLLFISSSSSSSRCTYSCGGIWPWWIDLYMKYLYLKSACSDTIACHVFGMMNFHPLIPSGYPIKTHFSMCGLEKVACLSACICRLYIPRFRGGIHLVPVMIRFQH